MAEAFLHGPDRGQGSVQATSGNDTSGAGRAGVKAEMLMIGDTAFDIEMARAADVRGVAVVGLSSPHRLHGAGASRIVNDMSELRDCLLESISSASRDL